MRRGDRAGWWVAAVLVVASVLVGFVADGVPAAVFMGGLSAAGAAIGLVWWIRVGRRRYARER